jgi:hypothetical protein
MDASHPADPVLQQPGQRPTTPAPSLEAFATRTGPAPESPHPATAAVPLASTIHSNPGPFNLSAFLSRFHAGPLHSEGPPPSFQPGSDGVNTSTVEVPRPPITAPSTSPDVATLMTAFAQFLQSTSGIVPGPSTEPENGQGQRIASPPPPATYSWTLANTRGAFPPDAIRNLRADNFPPPAHRARGDFVPAAVHSLAAHRLHTFLLTAEGQYESPMSTVLRFQILDCITFEKTPPI